MSVRQAEDAPVRAGRWPARGTAAARVRTAARHVWFWVRRYGLAEVGGTALIFATAAPVQGAGAPIAVVTVVAVVAENVGFYGVMAASVVRELRRQSPPWRRGAAARRAVALLVAEFGPAEALDSLLLRPAMVALALVVIGGGGALIVGKIAADLAFYAMAAASFSLTRHLGWRSRHVDD